MRALLRFTQAYDPLVLVDRPDLARDMMVDRHGLKTLPGQENIPVVVDHDMARRVGVVREMFTDTDTDGRRWNFASVTLDPNPPEWLKRDTPVSWSYKAFGMRDAAWGSPVMHLTDAFILEISVLRMKKPAEPLAKVLWVGELAEDHAAGEKVIVHNSHRRRTATPSSDEEMEELRRRLDWYERTRRRVDYGLVLENMQRELYPTIGDLVRAR